MKAILTFTITLVVGISLPCRSTLGSSLPDLAALPSTLYIALEEDLNDIHVSAQEEDGQDILSETFDKSEFYDELRVFYELIESRRLSNAVGHQMTVELGNKLFEPFTRLIQDADEVVFVVPPTFLELPMDLLSYEGQPLFLQKTVSYRIASTQIHFKTEEFQFSSLQSAFLVSDVTADPERAARSLADNFETVAYHDVTEVNSELLREQYGFDLLLMSVHGHINNTSEDYVGLWDDRAFSEDFSSITPKLAYFDSCRLGVSNSFIDAFTRVGSLYFVAPILSNEAGNSSTNTIELFFSHLEQGQRPEVALFNTRKELWNIYGDESFADRVWRAFPFRIYRLN